MIPLPSSRYEVKCGWKWDKDKQEYVDSGKGCGQKIFIEKLPGGKFKITNAVNGRGGNVGEAHKCHNTAYHQVDPNWAVKYHLAQQSLPCGLCGEKYNAEKIPVCPNCYKQQCRKCGAKQQWISGENVELNQCRACGAEDEGLDIIETFYHRKKLDPNFKTAREMMP